MSDYLKLKTKQGQDAVVWISSDDTLGIGLKSGVMLSFDDSNAAQLSALVKRWADLPEQSTPENDEEKGNALFLLPNVSTLDGGDAAEVLFGDLGNE